MDKEKYLIAKKNGKLEKLRSDEISRRFFAKYPLTEQVFILMDKDKNPDKYNACQEFRAKCEEEVDKEIAELENT